MVERRHAGEPDSIGHFPVGFAGWVVAYADHVPARVLAPQLRDFREHMRTNGRILALETVALGAIVSVYLCARDEGFVRSLDRRRIHHFAVDTRMERNARNLLFKGQWVVGNRNRRTPPAKPPD